MSLTNKTIYELLEDPRILTLIIGIAIILAIVLSIGMMEHNQDIVRFIATPGIGIDLSLEGCVNS
ncbi:MAG: hypothetical protein ACTHL3_08535 [Candidatus Nitrosocosmicus sp.]